MSYDLCFLVFHLHNLLRLLRLSVMMRNLSLLNSFKHGLFSWQLFSHKLCRWMVPFFMIFVFVSNAILMFSSMVWFLAFVLQIGFYFLALYYYKQHPSLQTSQTPSNSRYQLRAISHQLKTFSKLCYFFITVNLSIH